MLKLALSSAQCIYGFNINSNILLQQFGSGGFKRDKFFIKDSQKNILLIIICLFSQ